jgi:peptidoglycan/LPS O-acetylase OafA/YrhL
MSIIKNYATSYRPDIDGLRAVAVLTVVIFHFFPNLIPGGFIGVDVFFVISGYLISKIIFVQLGNGNFNILEFYFRRIKRIFPALIITLIICFAIGWFSLTGNEFKELGKYTAAGAAFISNLILWSDVGYFDTLANSKPLLNLWTLAIEEQFYIVWPLILLIAWKKNFNFFKLIIFLLLSSFFLNIAYHKYDTVLDFYSPQTRFWELLSGCLLAYLSLNKNEVFSKIKILKYLTEPNKKIQVVQLNPFFCNMMSVFGFILLFWGFFKISPNYNFPGFFALIPVVGGSLLIGAGSNALINRHILANKIFVYIGLISYPIYLLHWPLLTFAKILKGSDLNQIESISLILVVVILSWLIYVFVEKPIRIGNKGKGTVFFLILIMTLMGSIGLLTYYQNGFPQRYLNDVNSQNVREWRLAGDGVSDCSQLLKETESSFCATTANPTIAIVGDSHAGALFYGITHNTRNLNYRRAVIYGAGACQPSLGVESRSGCDKQLRIALDEIVKSDISTVIITGYYAFIDKHDSDEAREFLEGFLKTINLLQENNKKVVFLIDNPTLQKTPEVCIKKLWLRSRFTAYPKFCKGLEKSDMRDQTEYLKLIDELKSKTKKVLFIDPKEVLCPNKKCALYSDGLMLYSDYSHLSIYGSTLIANDIVHKLSIPDSTLVDE